MDADLIASTSRELAGGAGTLAATLALVAVAVATMRRAFRALLCPDEAARLLCRRWALVASAVVIAWSAIGPLFRVDPEIPILVAIAAADGWLVSWLFPPPAIPRATARRRSPVQGH